VILDKLVLENFGAYRGKHTIKLTPPSRKRPIILFGGLNGVGKTTLLDALQLVLYGKRARCSNRGTTNYEEFLRQCINRFSDPTGGARIELCFHQVNEGRDEAYRVQRSWHANGNGIKEIVEVEVDGVFDRTVSDLWSEYAEEFVPSRLSSLFFFDGEKIESLADIDNTADVLRNGIHSLLGLDIVDRLQDDLDVVANRKGKLLQIDSDKQEVIEAAEAEVRGLSSRRDEILQNAAGVQSQLDQCSYRLNQVNEKLRAEGGDLFRQKDLLESNRISLVQEMNDTDAELREVGSGAAPLLLAGKLLIAVQEQVREERQSLQAEMLDETLRERDALVLKTVNDNGIPKKAYENLAAFLAMDRKERTATRNLPRYLLLDEDASGLVHDLQSVTLREVREKILSLLKGREDLSRSLTVIERKLTTVPDADAIMPYEHERAELENKKAGLETAAAHLADERQRLEYELGRKESVLKRLQDEAARGALEQEDLARINVHARRAQATLMTFRDRVVERHLERIEMHIEDSFRHLLRRQSLVSSLRINRATYAIELRDSMGNVVRPDRLSAGERQLLAVSLLWGLAKASRRALPAVIDTPLGRLDSTHRRHLVKRYFPFASHQVLLLSTDEEIRGEYLDELRPSVGRSYLLQYDEAAHSTEIVEGYFATGDAHVA
jgi:DNA sulfur modification protein DndD